MHRSKMSFVLFFVVNTAAFAQTSSPHDDAGHTKGGTARSHPTFSINTGKSGNLSHGGLITPRATNDRGLMQADRSTDTNIRNPGNSQSLITHTGPQSQ